MHRLTITDEYDEVNDFLNRFDDARRDLRSAAGELRMLVDAFARTGNPIVAEHLERVAEKILDSERTADTTVSQLISKRFVAVREASDNMLMAVLLDTTQGQKGETV
jgi:hypothetical protein